MNQHDGGDAARSGELHPYGGPAQLQSHLQSGRFHCRVSRYIAAVKQPFGLRLCRGAISKAQGRVSAMSMKPGNNGVASDVECGWR